MNIHRRLITLYAIFSSLLFVTACSSTRIINNSMLPTATARPNHSPPPTLTAVPTLTPIPNAIDTGMAVNKYDNIEWTICPFEELNVSAGVATCGYLIAPEDHASPDGKKIKLFFARFLKANRSATGAPIFVLAGGPGGSSLDLVEAQFSKTFLPFTRDHDVIALDQRGTGHSRPYLDCDDLNAFIDTSEWNAFIRYLEECRLRYVDDGVSLDAYNTPQSAADIDLLRQTLGYKKMTLWGSSYGTTLALTAMRSFSSTIEAAILDGVVAPNINRAAEVDWLYDHAFQRIIDACAADIDCNDYYPDLGQHLHELVSTFNRRPVWIAAKDSYSSGTYLNGFEFAELLFQAMYSSRWAPYIPRVIDDTYADNYYYLSYLTENAGDRSDGLAGVLRFNIECAEEFAFTNKSEAATSRSTYAWLYANRSANDVRDWSWIDMCAKWATTPIDTAEIAPVISDIPTLLVSSEFDPVTPPYYAEDAASTLSHATHIVIRGGGHSVLSGGNPCAVQVALAFANEPNPTPDTQCVAAEPAMKFYLD